MLPGGLLKTCITKNNKNTELNRKKVKIQEWIIYDLFRNLKNELEIDLNSLKRFFEGSKTLSFCQNYY